MREYLTLMGLTFFSLLAIKKRRYFLACLFYIVAIFSAVYHGSISFYLQNLGADSFAESTTFSIQEASFWLETLRSVIKPEIIVKKIVLCTLLAAVVYFLIGYVFYKKIKSEKKFGQFTVAIGALLIANGMWQLIGSPLILFFENSDIYYKVDKNFNGSLPPAPEDAGNDLSVLVYIGESTTVMNMGLYGYPRNTTPELSNLAVSSKGLLVFKNVFSTHTHTTPSLLEALSFSEEGAGQVTPINDQKRLSLVNLLEAADIPVWLYSNQGQSGTWNLGANILFKSAKRQYSIDDLRSGNIGGDLPRPYDADFFQSPTGPMRTLKEAGKKAVFFHSYAGHGPYEKNIPQAYQKEIDDFYKGRTMEGIGGKLWFSKEGLEGYDQAVRYIDYSVANAIESIKNLDEPYVFIYFSDHGEAVFTDRGHDSARYLHEMLRVPFIIYFNDAAIVKYPELFRKYKKLSGDSYPSTLAQLSSTIIDLLGLHYSKADLEKFKVTPVVGSPSSGAPIVVRKTSSGTEYVRMNPIGSDQDFIGSIDKTDTATVAFRTNLDRPAVYCYHRSNSLAKALRGVLATNCLEMDVFVEDNGQIDLHHPPELSTGYSLQDAINVAQGKGKSLWLDSKNLDDPARCHVFDQFMAKQNIKRFNEILVELPPGSYQRIELDSCARSLRAKGLAVSYYVPTDVGMECNKALESGIEFQAAGACTALADDVGAALKSGFYTDISFDYAIQKPIEKLQLDRKIRWNTWHVKESVIKELDLQRFRMIILVNDDPNNI